ncbi:mismatch repair ATPase MLH1 Ecym_3383 [Eremothecium cymbalariae DBVPG|uniref:DNA mismatch repair protein S5 domain-containing protein n=1 Tax=Eremothecium cymbalariae (strain CBS 270.75 / DBVPG 7215 / KCTC 17166 / NRRL Y-17582) TaxID=931890 RepID=G8JRV1_ERECY|nr:Hypothetical protein Ecym_3383 [Eremothecium cymbalariae DBVPG\
MIFLNHNRILMSAASRIKALDASVVNKIAAGEIIISPVNALKEMLENSIDAGATHVDVLIKEGGVRLLQIVDNGSGIMKDDLPILCERFTTSKLTTFEDLNKIQTYGFRGEALASISHIAKLTVITKTKDDTCAWKTSYKNGKITSDSKPTAGKDGTVIIVEDLFYNIPSRLRSLRSSAEEFAKILDVLCRYAIHTDNVGFSCKKFGESQFSLNVRSEATRQERIRSIFGSQVSNNLISLDMQDNREYGIVENSGKISNLNYNIKKGIPAIFFINHRLVSCDPLRRSLFQVYSNFLPKGSKPFIYLSLVIAPANVDVNVHPTKREVRFLHEDEIIECISNKVQEELQKIASSKSFKPGSLVTNKLISIDNASPGTSSTSMNSAISKIKRQENKLIRTDSSQTKITNFIRSSQPKIHASFSTSIRTKPKPLLESDENTEIVPRRGTPEEEGHETLVGQNCSNNSRIIKSLLHNTYEVVQRERIDVNLTSIKSLKETVDNETHKELTGVFADMTYIGIVDETRRLASIQHGLKLFLVDYGSLCNELFYQIGLTDFANFGKIYIHDELENKEGLLLSSLLSRIDNLSSTNMDEIIKRLWNMKEMLDEYYSIELKGGDDSIQDVRINCVPLLLKDYMPPLSKLPFFIYRMGTKVNWGSEKDCLDGILKQLALFYIPEIIEHVDQDDVSVTQEIRTQAVSKTEYLSTVLEQVIFPTIKRRLLAPKGLLKDVIEIANLPGLYKVFERC